MARRRRSKRHDDRDAQGPSPTSLAPAGRQALHRAMVRSVNDLRQFHPQPELIHAINKNSSRLVLAKRVKRAVHAVRQAAPRLSRTNVSKFRRLRRGFIARNRRHVARAASPLAALLRVRAPRDVAICVRRHIRREVMFATGRGGSKKISRKRRRNDLSNIRCK